MAASATLTDRLPSQLQPGLWFICGDDGSGHSFNIYPPTTADLRAPVVVYIPGAGGLWDDKALNYQNTPVPSWAVVWNVPGTHRVRTPSYMPSFLEWLRKLTKQTQNKIIVVGFSRGAAWIIDLVQTQAENIDAAVAFAGYPWTKDKWENERESRRLMQVRIPLLLVHFDCDEVCNSTKYDKWYAQFEIAMQAPPGEAFGQRWQGFLSIMCKGVHDVGRTIFESMDFAKASDGGVFVFWKYVWEAIAEAKAQAQ